MEIRHLPAADVTLLGAIDRSERITTAYSVTDGALVTTEVDWDVPGWSPEGTGGHSVHRIVEFTRAILDDGGILLGAFDGNDLMGLCVIVPEFEDDLAWMALLHVSRAHRRRGAATTLWDEAVRLSLDAGRRRMYVSATPSGSAVGFYLSRGCVLARPPHPDLLALEPEDVHLVADLEGSAG